MRRALGIGALLLALVGCSSLEGVTEDIKARVGEIDLQETLSGLTDCERLADAFLEVVENTVAVVDETGGEAGSIPAGDLADIVDEVSVSQYYDLAERIGCARVQAQLDLMDRLVELNAKTGAGESVLDEVIDSARSAG